MLILAVPKMSQTNDKDFKSKLIASVKKEVKQVMEESVTKKFVHQDSGCVTSLCGAVEACLSQGLKRRALGLFKTSSTTALLHKIAKHCPEAASISRKVQDIENIDPNKRSSSSSDSLTKPILQKTVSLQNNTNPLPKYLWIRLALFDRHLARIIDFLVSNADRYYDKDSLVADPDYGNILSSLLVGPCALDYSKSKTMDHFWTDPSADDLVQKHRISASHSTPPPVRTPILNFRRSLNTSSEESSSSRNSTQLIARDYVESLHQNSRATLLFGKNNVRVLPNNSGLTAPMPGYLSLHQAQTGLIIKWTPNQLMNGFTEENEDTSVYWDFALHVKLDDIVYVHCHQDSETGGTIILVGQDGVQRPPINFPKGGHMLAFLSCIETGLLPRGRLDPPLWTQRSGTYHNKRRRPLSTLPDSEETSKDYVFRIVDITVDKDILKRYELLDPTASIQSKTRVQLCSTSTTSSDSSSKSFSIDQNAPDSPPTVYIQAVCESMKRQIISRAFYGWLAYCRHLSTVRRHLSGLVNSKIISGSGAEEGITVEKWSELCIDEVVTNSAEVYRLAYFGGVAHELRREIWPYLLRHYKFGSTKDQRNQLNEETKQWYENKMSEWIPVEAIVKQRNKEKQERAIKKVSSESTSGDALPPAQIQRELSNDVFEDITDDDDTDPVEDTDHENTPKLRRSKRNTIRYDSNEEIDKNEDNHEPDDISEPNYMEDKEFGEDFETDHIRNIIVTNPSIDRACFYENSIKREQLESVSEENNSLDACVEAHGLASPARSACVSPATSNGGEYTQDTLDTFGVNLHLIENDVDRCDRSHWYFSENHNLEKLRNVMCTYVWEHNKDIGYIQGMCDLVAPLLVIFDEESLTYACFSHLMERMAENLTDDNAMDSHFANMRSLTQVLDSEMYELIDAQGDYTHFYFCYRWFKLDFKRELLYPDVYMFWETIWTAQHIASAHFVLFLALSLVETYRNIILSESMNFTDLIKFFNERAEHHDAKYVLNLARNLVLKLQELIENK